MGEQVDVVDVLQGPVGELVALALPVGGELNPEGWAGLSGLA